MESGRLALSVAVVAAVLVQASGFVVLKDLAHIQLKDSTGAVTINASTYNRLAYDSRHSIMYVVAREPRRLTALQINADDTATVLVEHRFPDNHGYPLDVEICYNVFHGHVGWLAISFEDPLSSSGEGVVRFFQPFTHVHFQLTLLKEITVGSEPVDLEFAQACAVLLSANRGRPTLEGRTEYVDPEGSVTQIFLPPVLDEDAIVYTTTISFGHAFRGDFAVEDFDDLRHNNFRAYPLRNPTGDILSVEQNIEPERIVVTPNGQLAYVSLPKNNAIARIRIDSAEVQRIFPLGNRSWTDYYMDPSDKDHAINLRPYNIYGLTQSKEMVWVSEGGAEWVVSLDTGILNYLPAYKYADHARAKDLLASGALDTLDAELQAKLSNDSELGRLFVSKEDGHDEHYKITDIFTFGGRGFSIRNTETFETPTVIVDDVERQAERYYGHVFHTAFMNEDHTPRTDKEATSPSLGPELTSLAVGEFQGKKLLFVAGGQSGMVYVYILSPDAQCLQPYFHSIHRSGETASSWKTAFDHGDMGDIGITDMIYLSSEDLEPMLAVTSATSNSLSLYRVAEEPFMAPHN